jgi:two-component system sensor histidine kinase KdpD
VLFVALTWGLLPSLFACLVSMLTYNFFFLPPIHTFTIGETENIIAVFFFLLVAVLTGNLAARVRSQALTARSRAKTTEALYAFSRKLAGVAQIDDLLWATAYQIASMLNTRVVVLLDDDRGFDVRAGYPPEDELDEADFAAAKWTFEHNHPAGRGADTLPGAKRLFIPLRTARTVVGVVGIDRDAPGPLLTPDQRRLLDALCDQTAVAVERIRLAEAIDAARVLAETERLRSALLASISHDLRTPLASIIGSASSLQNYDSLYDQGTREELISTIQEEAERLGRFVNNLLDITRLESGAIEPRRDAVDLGDIVGTALNRAARVTSHHHVAVDLAADLPMLPLDPVLFEQVLFNLLDNAAKYAPPGTTITLRAKLDGSTVLLEIMDEGPGIPETELESVFDKFYRVRGRDRQRAGTGLGLAVCRGFVEAMGGTIEAHNRSDRSGAIFAITLPASEAGGERA